MPDEPEGATAAAIAATLAADTTAQLTAGWAGAASRRGAIRDALADLLGLTVLPAPPTAVQIAASRSNLATAVGVTGAQIDAALVDVVHTVLADAAGSLTPVAGSFPSTGDAATFLVAAQIPAHWSNIDSNIHGSFTSHTADWAVLILDRLTQAVQSVLLPAGTVSTDADLLAVAQALLALALLRVRAFRMGLLCQLHKQMFGEDNTTNKANLTAINPLVVGGTTYQIPAATAGGMSLEIEAAYGLDSVTSPPDGVPTWSPLERTQPPNADAVHSAALALEKLFTPIDDAGATGGSAYETDLSDSITSQVAPALATRVFRMPDDPVLRLRTVSASTCSSSRLGDFWCSRVRRPPTPPLPA